MKIGLLGGSFNPPHFGHLGISKDALEFLELDEIWWLPTKQNPLKNHKNNNFDQRLKLCEKVIDGEEKIIVKDLEKYLKSSYFIDLLEIIISQNPENEFFLMIGSDNLINFHLWFRWQDVIKLAKIVVFRRDNFEKEAKNSKTNIFCEELGKKERVIFMKNKEYNISSTEIRNKNEK